MDVAAGWIFLTDQEGTLRLVADVNLPAAPSVSSKRRMQEHTRRELLQRLLVAQEEERRRIAQDLHDHAGQLLTALIMRLDQLSQQAAQLVGGTIQILSVPGAGTPVLARLPLLKPSVSS